MIVRLQTGLVRLTYCAWAGVGCAWPGAGPISLEWRVFRVRTLLCRKKALPVYGWRVSFLGWVWSALAQHLGVKWRYWTPFHMLGLWLLWDWLACLCMGRLSIFEQIKYKSYQGFCRWTCGSLSWRSLLLVHLNTREGQSIAREFCELCQFSSGEVPEGLACFARG